MVNDTDQILLVWKESPAMIRAHVEGMAENFGRDWQGSVVVVWNGGHRETLLAATKEVRRAWPNARHVSVRMARNRGFGAAVNVGFLLCRAPYVAVFNPDGVLARGAVGRLHGRISAAPEAIAVCAIVSGHSEGHATSSAILEVGWVPGGAALFRRRAFLDVGGYDPIIFLFWEDRDLGRRARTHGWSMWRDEEATFWHPGRPAEDWAGLHREMHMAASAFSVTWIEVPEGRVALRRALGKVRRRGEAHLRRRPWSALLSTVLALGVGLKRTQGILARRRRGWTGQNLRRWACGIRGVDVWMGPGLGWRPWRAQSWEGGSPDPFADDRRPDAAVRRDRQRWVESNGWGPEAARRRPGPGFMAP